MKNEYSYTCMHFKKVEQDDDNNNYYKTPITPISSKRIELSGGHIVVIYLLVFNRSLGTNGRNKLFISFEHHIENNCSYYSGARKLINTPVIITNPVHFCLLTRIAASHNSRVTYGGSHSYCA